MMDYKKIGEFISNRRKELGFTQKELGEKLNLTDKAVSKWERGLGCPDISILGELSEVLDVGIGEILNGEYNESLKENLEFIKNAVDYSKKITEDNIYIKIKNILYIILIIITIYMTFMGVRQLIYINGSFEYIGSKNILAYIEFQELKENVKIIKEKGYLHENNFNSGISSSLSYFNYDYADSLNYLIKQLEYTNLLSGEDVNIKNVDLYNIDMLIHKIHNADIYCLYKLTILDSENSDFYKLGIIEQYFDMSSFYIINENGKPVYDSLYGFPDFVEIYYSDELYKYSFAKENKFKASYNELGIKLEKLNNTLNFVIKVGEEHENN